MFNSLLAVDSNINLIPNNPLVTNVTGITAGGLIRSIIILLLVISALIFFIMLLVGGLQWILSGGDKGKTEAARNRITAALIGLVIVFTAWAILQLMSAFLGVELNNFTIPNINQQ